MELWYAGTLTYGNGANSGILSSTNGNQLKVTSTKLTLPFKITNGIISSSVVWYFTEWTQAQISNDNVTITIRKFSNDNSVNETKQFTYLYVKGTLV